MRVPHVLVTCHDTVGELVVDVVALDRVTRPISHTQRPVRLGIGDGRRRRQGRPGSAW